MAIGSKLYRGSVLLGLAVPEAFADWTHPTSTELNNYASGLIWNVSCALNEAGTKFDLGDSDTDDTLSFCSTAGVSNPTFYNPDVVYEVNRSTSPTAVDQANTAFNLLAFPDTDFFTVLRLGKAADANWAVGDQVSLFRVTTDYPVQQGGSGDSATVAQNFLPSGDVLWNYTLTA